jgi:hypothetical protein
LTSLESPEKAIQSKPNVALFRKQPKIKQTNVLTTKAIMADSPRKIRLFCYILGVSVDPFSVQIQDDDTVDDLKLAIVKAKPIAFAQVDFDQLTVWKACHFCTL